MSQDLLHQALAAHQGGDLAAAEAGYRAVLAEEPDQADALALLGVALDSLGKADEALACLHRALELDPKAGLFRIYMGNMMASRGLWPQAVEAFRVASDLLPNMPDVHYNLGNALRENNEWDAAEQAYLKTLALAPDHAQARNNLALVYEHDKRLEEAYFAFQNVTLTAPDYLDGWLNLSSLAEKTGHFEEALEAAHKAKALAPEQGEPLLGIGVALNRLGRDEEALPYYKEALRLKPDWTEVWDNIGQTYQNLNRLDEAEAAYHRCIACAGQTIADEDSRRVDEREYGGRHWHLALLELLMGNLKSGFSRYRARFKDVKGLEREPWPRPVWQGEDLAGKTILVMDEQGAGDCLMMMRYLPLLKERGARVFLYVSPALAPLFEGWGCVDTLYRRGETIADFDYYASIFDLPYAFGTTLETIPAKVPYLPVLAGGEDVLRLCEGQRPEAIQNCSDDSGWLRYARNDRRAKIGVVWAGAPLHKHDRKRSLPISAFERLFQIKDFQFYSFNRDKREGDDAVLQACGVIDLAPALNSFADSARLMGQMDLVISCDTATAHLAGGLGRPVWTLLPFAPDWRWMTAREDSPWYPTMRLFRQKTSGDWAGVMESVERALRASGLSRASL